MLLFDPLAAPFILLMASVATILVVSGAVEFAAQRRPLIRTWAVTTALFAAPAALFYITLIWLGNAAAAATAAGVAGWFAAASLAGSIGAAAVRLLLPILPFVDWRCQRCGQSGDPRLREYCRWCEAGLEFEATKGQQ